MNELTPDIFLCHNRADKPWVRHLGERLEAESIDGSEAGQKIRVFLDEWDIEKGENIVTRLAGALASGALVAAVMSPEFFDSGWTQFEWTDVVARDPANKGGLLLPIRLRDVSLDGSRRIAIPAPFNAINGFDFRSQEQFESVFEDLLRRIRKQPIPRGAGVRPRYSFGVTQRTTNNYEIEAAESVDEILVSNLAPITASPPALYMARTTLKNLSEIPPNLGASDISMTLWDGKIVTYADIEDPECVLNAIVDPYSIERLEFERCLKDTDIANQWIALANKSLARVLLKKGVAQDAKKRFYFLPGLDRTDRSVTIGPHQPRLVAAKKRQHVTGREFWVHYCASIRFRLIGSKVFLRILPSYSFTHDGYESLDNKQAGRYRVIWGGKQDSATVLRQVLFWLQYLSDGHEEFVLETGGEAIRISVMPATALTKFGVRTDHTRIKALVDSPSTDELTVVADSTELAESVEDSTEEADEIEGTN